MTRVFVVDDDPVVCRLARFILERAGYEVRLLQDGQEALEALEQSAPDILITDLMMPRMDGMTLLRHIRANVRWVALPVVVFTARGGENDRRLAEEAGASHFLTKPFSSAQLLDAIKQLVPPAQSVSENP